MCGGTGSSVCGCGLGYVCYSVCMKSSGKGINPGPVSCPPVVNSKPSGGGRVGPALVYAENPHPKAGKSGRSGEVSAALKGWS